MKRLNGYRMTLVFAGVVIATFLGGRSAKADFTFGEPVHLDPPISNSAGSDCPAWIIDDGLTMYFDSWRPSGYGMYDIWVTTKSTKDDPWGTPVNLGPQVNSSAQDGCATITADGLELYLFSYRSGGYGQGDIYVSRRDTNRDEWGPAVNLGSTLNGSSDDLPSWVSPDGLELYFMSTRSGGYGRDDIWVTTRATRSDSWEAPVNLGPEVNSAAREGYPFVSPDGLTLFFSEEVDPPFRSGGFGRGDMWVAMRTSVSEPWGAPLNLGAVVNSPSYDGGPRISPDGSTLYFCSARPGSLGGSYGDIYEAPIIPIVDFNGDMSVDVKDVVIMTEHWGEDYSLCDIGPMPWGDGIVDVQDLIVLAEHLFKEVDDPTLIAHWPLDETGGMVITGRAGDNDGYALGDPVWQPDGGQVDGALQLDGVDDYVVTGSAPKPEMGSYSVLAWIKGGAPGQVVLSQMGKANWLCADPLEGFLMTELTVTGRNSCSLGSEAVITDGNWHRIAFVWDGSYRRLYVDGVIVAEDVQDNLDISVNGLYFGTGKTMEPGTFFSGLIDDVRIYNRAVKP